MSKLAQLSLDLGQRTALGREDFLVAPSNEMAVAWIDRWPAWPGPALVLHGPAGSGKSHLCQVWLSVSGAVRIDAAKLAALEPPELLGATKVCALDDTEDMLGNGGENAIRLLHLYNTIAERGGHMLLTGRSAPARWRVGLRDLETRLAAASAIELKAPGDALIESVMVKLFSDRQLRVGAKVIAYLIPRMERSLDAARVMVADLDRAALADRREITVPLARGVLAKMASLNKD